MYVEDLFLSISDQFYYKHSPFDGMLDGEWHRSFITNVATHVRAGHQLSTNQSQTILKLIARVRHHIVAYGLATDLDISDMLTNPDHRRALYESLKIPREVRYLGSNFLGFRYKQNDIITKRIKSFGEPQTSRWHQLEISYTNLEFIMKPRFDWMYRIWIVPIFRHNLLLINQLINEYRFKTDAATSGYLALASRSVDKPSTFTIYDEFILGNVCDNPLLASWITEIADSMVL